MHVLHKNCLPCATNGEGVGFLIINASVRQDGVACATVFSQSAKVKEAKMQCFANQPEPKLARGVETVHLEIPSVNT